MAGVSTPGCHRFLLRLISRACDGLFIDNRPLIIDWSTSGSWNAADLKMHLLTGRWIPMNRCVPVSCGRRLIGGFSAGWPPASDWPPPGKRGGAAAAECSNGRWPTTRSFNSVPIPDANPLGHRFFFSSFSETNCLLVCLFQMKNEIQRRN